MADETLFWGLDVDTRGINQAFAALVAGVQNADRTLTALVKEAGQGFTMIAKEIQGVSADMRGVLAPAVATAGKAGRKGLDEAAQAARQLKAEARAVAVEVTSLTKQADAMAKAFRQADMSKWEKAADNYASKLKDAQGTVARIQQKLADAKTTDEQRAKLAEQLAKAQAEVLRLQDGQAKASARAAAEAQKQAQAELDKAQALKKAEQEKAAAVAKTRQEREASAKAAEAERQAAAKAAKEEREAAAAAQAAARSLAAGQREQERQAVAAARAAEKSLAAGQRERDRNAAGLNRGVDRFDSSLSGQIGAIATTIRQAGMTEWQKLADDYGAAISRAHGRVKELKASLDGTYVSEKDRLAIQQRIAEAEKQIGQLTAVSAQHVDQVRVAEEKRAQAMRASAAEVRQALQDAATIAGTIGGAILAGFGGAGKKFAELSDQTAAFKATANATEAEVKTLVDTAKGLEGIKTTAAAQAAVELTRAGLSAKEATENLGLFNNAAIATGESMDTVSKIILSTNRAFGLSNAELKNTGDILARTANVSATNIAEVGHAMSIMASTSKTTGQSLIGISTAFGVLRDAGVSAEMAATGLKNALGDMNSPTDKQTAAMDRLFKTTNAVKKVFQENGEVREWADVMADIRKQLEGMSKVEQGQILKQIFPDERAFNIVQSYLAQTEEKIASNTQAMSAYGDEIDRAAGIMKESFGHQIRELQKDFEDLQLEVAEDVLPVLKALVGGAKEVIEVFDSIPGPIKTIMEYVALLAGGVFTAFAGTAGIVFVVGKGIESFTTLGNLLKGKVAVDAAAAASGIGKVGEAGKVAATGGLATFGAAALGLVVAGGAIFLLLKAVKDLNQALDQLDDNLQTSIEARQEFAGALKQALILESEGKKLTHEQIRDAARDAQTLINENTTKLQKLKELLPELERLRREQAAAGPQQMAPKGGAVFNPRPGRIKELEEELQKLGFVELASGKLRGQLSAIAQELISLDQHQARFVKRAGELGQKEREAAANAVKHQVDQINNAEIRLDQMDRELKKQLDLNKARQIDRDKAIAAAEKQAHAHNHGGTLHLDPRASGVGAMTSDYGWRTHPIFGTKRMHTGQDFAVAHGAPIKSQLEGTVAFSGWAGGYGKTVIVEVAPGKYILYAHNSELTKAVGDTVKKGEMIARAGSTGNSTGPHSHQEIRSGRAGIRNTMAGMEIVDPRTGTAYSGSVRNFAQEKLESEARTLQDNLAVWQAFLKKYEAALAALDTADKDYATKSKQLGDKIIAAQQQVTETRQKLQEKGFDIDKLELKGAEDAIKERRRAISDELKRIKGEFDAFAKDAHKAAEEGKKFFYEARQEPEDITESRAFNILGEMTKQIEAGEQKLLQMREKYAEARKNLPLMGPDERKQLEGLKALIDEQVDSVGRLKFQLKELGGTFEDLPGWGDRKNVLGTGVLSSLATALAGNDLDKYLDKLDDANDKGREFVAALMGNAEALESFNLALEGDFVDIEHLGQLLGYSTQQLKDMGVQADELGRVNLDFLNTQIGLTENQLSELMNTLGRADAMKDWSLGIDAAVKALEKIKAVAPAVSEGVAIGIEGAKAWGGELADAIGNIVGTIGGLGAAFRQFGGEAAEAFAGVTDAAAGLTSGIAGLVAAVASKSPFQAVSAGVQIIGSVFAGVTALIHESTKQAQAFNDELLRTKRLSGDQKEAYLEQAVIDRERAGKDSKPAKQALFVHQRTKARDELIDPLQKSLAYAVVGENGELDLDATERNINEGFARELANPKLASDSPAKIKALREKALNDLKEIRFQMSEAQRDIQNNWLSLTEGAADAADKSTAKVEESTESLLNYFRELARDDRHKDLTEEFLDTVVGKDASGEARDRARAAAESVASEYQAVMHDVDEAFKGSGGLAGEAGWKEWTERLEKLMPGFRKRITEALAKANQEAREKDRANFEKDLKAREDQFKAQIEALKKAAGDLYEEEAQDIRELIKLDEQRIKGLEKANKLIEDRIRLKEDERKKDLADFEGQDLGEFAKLVKQVDFDAELRQGLKDIHNPDGVPTGTYSGQSHLEAMKERLDLLRLQNENKLGLEQYDPANPAKNKAAYLTERKRIDAIEARFVEEELKRTDLTNRQRLELEAQMNAAYSDFKQAHIESLNNAKDQEIAILQEQIDANSRAADNIRSSIATHQEALDDLSSRYQAQLSQIDERIASVMDSQSAWAGSAQALKEGIEGPLNDIISLYQKAKKAIKDAFNAGVPNVAQIGLDYAAGHDGKRYATTSELWGLGKKMATGGVVPPGFPNDTFPAMLNSGEPVFPAWFANLLEQSYRMNMGGPRTIHNQSRGDVHVHVHGGDIEAVRREFRKALSESEYSGARINGANYLN